MKLGRMHQSLIAIFLLFMVPGCVYLGLKIFLKNPGYVYIGLEAQARTVFLEKQGVNMHDFKAGTFTPAQQQAFDEAQKEWLASSEYAAVTERIKTNEQDRQIYDFYRAVVFLIMSLVCYLLGLVTLSFPIISSAYVLLGTYFMLTKIMRTGFVWLDLALHAAGLVFLIAMYYANKGHMCVQDSSN